MGGQLEGLIHLEKGNWTGYIGFGVISSIFCGHGVAEKEYVELEGKEPEKELFCRVKGKKTKVFLGKTRPPTHTPLKNPGITVSLSLLSCNCHTATHGLRPSPHLTGS